MLTGSAVSTAAVPATAMYQPRGIRHAACKPGKR